jgi:hypothetical protein
MSSRAPLWLTSWSASAQAERTPTSARWRTCHGSRARCVAVSRTTGCSKGQRVHQSRDSESTLTRGALGDGLTRRSTRARMRQCCWMRSGSEL